MKSISAIVEQAGVEMPERTGALIGDGVTSHLPSENGPELGVRYPATAERVTWLVESGPAEVDEAVSAARESFESGVWRGLPSAKRAAVLRRGAELIRRHADELAVLEVLCAGLPLAHLVRRQLPRAAENFSFFADHVEGLSSPSLAPADSYDTHITYEPAGVAALLTPFNAPLAMASMRIASCIAFGNSCVIKPSEYSPLSVRRLVELLIEGGVPPGVVNLVNGRGSLTGDSLVSHPDIDRIALTGRSGTGRKVMARAAARLVPVQLQLGGNGATIIFEDADLDRAIDGALISAFGNSGQMCVAAPRILVDRRIATTIIERFVERVEAIRVGDPTDLHTECGPLAYREHMDSVLACIARAQEEGAEILTGGAAVEALLPGYFVAPTVMTVADSRPAICREEVLGPVAIIRTFDAPEEAISLANDSNFGLVCYAWTGDASLVKKLQCELQVGTLWINTPLIRDLRAPFGGMKQSGIGRDGARECAEFFSEAKAIIRHRGSAD